MWAKSLLLIGSIHAEEEVIRGHFVHQDVVDKAAVFVQQTGVVRLAHFQFRGGVGGHEIDQLLRFRAADIDFAHVADIEQTGGAADGVMLLDQAGILHRHVPAAEIDHLGLRGPMYLIQRSFAKRIGLHERRE